MMALPGSVLVVRAEAFSVDDATGGVGGALTADTVVVTDVSSFKSFAFFTATMTASAFCSATFLSSSALRLASSALLRSSCAFSEALVSGSDRMAVVVVADGNAGFAAIGFVFVVKPNTSCGCWATQKKATAAKAARSIVMVVMAYGSRGRQGRYGRGGDATMLWLIEISSGGRGGSSWCSGAREVAFAAANSTNSSVKCSWVFAEPTQWIFSGWRAAKFNKDLCDVTMTYY